jgi:Icc-related predicted phosphoesterase
MGLFRKREQRDLIRIFVASDLHGSTRCFQKFLRAAEFYEADVLMIAGDLTGKMIVPIVEQSGRYTTHFQGRQDEVPFDELAAHEEMIESAGLYAYRTTPDEIEELNADSARVDAIFHALVLERVERWAEMAEDRLRSLDRRCYLIAGNDDYPEIDDVLRGGDRFEFVDGTKATVADRHEVIGLGVANITPWNAPRDLPEQEISARLEALTATLDKPETAIYLIHVPPAGSLLDMAPEIDENLRPTGAGDNMVHVGSTAVRECITATQPLVSLHGHIHESRGYDKIGRTATLNPGSEYGEGLLRGVLVNLSEDKFESHLFVSG